MFRIAPAPSDASNVGLGGRTPWSGCRLDRFAFAGRCRRGDFCALANRESSRRLTENGLCPRYSSRARSKQAWLRAPPRWRSKSGSRDAPRRERSGVHGRRVESFCFARRRRLGSALERGVPGRAHVFDGSLGECGSIGGSADVPHEARVTEPKGPVGNRLFVGNLSFSTTQATIEAAFAAAGEVVEVALPVDRESGQPRGFAFVTMADGKAAANAISQLNGAEIDGRQIRVDEAQERPRGGGGGGGGGGGFRGGGGGHGGGGGRKGGGGSRRGSRDRF
ncbi:MAG TPA: hypothetical protein VGK73_19965 [Polyangiaceae bacterium]